MTLEQLVPSLELCQKAQRLGWKRETYFYYALWYGEWVLIDRNSMVFARTTSLVPAPILQEVFEELSQIGDVEITYSQRIGAWYITVGQLESSRVALVEAALELWCELEESKVKQ